MLPRVIADDDRTRFLLFDHIVEIFHPVRSPKEWRDIHDRQRIRVDRHLRYAAGLARSRQRDWGAATLEEAERFERLTMVEHRPDDLPAWRLFTNAFLGVRAPQHDKTVDISEAKLVVGHPVHHAVHRGR